jgi:hypothetical protein
LNCKAREAVSVEKKLFGSACFFDSGNRSSVFRCFLASYALALPSNLVLHGQPIFRIPLSIFGGLFLALTAIAIVLSFIVKPED